MKKNVAIAMTAAMTLGAVPVFADQQDTTPENVDQVVDLRKIEGRRLAEGKDIGATNVTKKIFNKDEVDQLLAEEKFEAKVVGKVADGEDEKYVVAINTDYTNEEMKAESDKVKEIEDLIRDLKNDFPNQYEVELERNEVSRPQNTDGTYQTLKDTELIVRVINTNDMTGEDDGVAHVFVFTGIDTDFGFGQDFETPEDNIITLNNFPTIVNNEDYINSDYKKLDKYIYSIEKALEAGKVTAHTNKVLNADNRTTGDLEIKILLGDGNTIGKITLENAVQADKREENAEIILNKAPLKMIPLNNDFRGHWAEDIIVEAMLDGVVDVSSTFNPEKNSTRAEFAKMACKAYGVEFRGADNPGDTLDKENYSDVKPGDWYYGYIAALTTRGYINGYEDGTFKPDATITRQEAAKIVALLEANKDNVDTITETVETVTVDQNGNDVHHFGIDSTTGEKLNKQFSDVEEIHNWADESIDSLVRAEKINGFNDDTFKPVNQISKVQSLAMMRQSK